MAVTPRLPVGAAAVGEGLAARLIDRVLPHPMKGKIEEAQHLWLAQGNLFMGHLDAGERIASFRRE